MWLIFYSLKAAVRFHDYKPLPVSALSAHRWMGQLDGGDRRLVGRLLDNVVYYSAHATKRILVELNQQLLQRLANDGVPAKRVVYVSFDDAASSSPVMLSILRDNDALEQRGCTLCDGNDIRKLKDVTEKLEAGAIVYVDDFIGSASQFSKARRFFIQYVFTNFAEFMLVPSICEEGRAELQGQGVEVIAHYVHLKSHRALQPSCTFFSEDERARITRICERIDSKMALGVQSMAAMVVFYRNSPNQIPAVLRGNKDLKPFQGLFPRTKDLPFVKIVAAKKRAD